jgi:Flp pilus assembly protein TadG
MWSIGKNLWREESGAIASVYALALPALIAVGGIAFDYARLAAMDSELQNAADQSALAAVTQLDGRAGACSRASGTAVSFVTNQARMANDGIAPAVTINGETACDSTGKIRFWQNSAKTQPATNDANARFVEITVNARTAEYILTPVVGAFSSGAIDATAMAGLGSAICRVPPVMLCNPQESTDPNFTITDYIGDGVRLVANDGGGAYGPGLFGFLETGAGNGAQALSQALGRTVPPGDCVESTGVEPSSGNMVSVRDAMNTRFDIYANGLNQACDNDGSLCPPSLNTRKDVLISGNNPAGQAPFQGGNGNGGNIWRLPTNPDTQHYPPVALTTVRTLAQNEINQLWPMGFPRDICHATSTTGSCGGAAADRIGDGVWDRNAYFRSNDASYPTVPTAGDLNNWFGTTTPTRYEVYRWEIANAATRLVTQTVGGNGNNARTSYGQPVNRTGITPSNSTVDRRRLSVAVINCTANGVRSSSTNVPVEKWIDVFLVEPTLPRSRTENSDIYVEVIGETATAGGGGTVGQVVRRDTPYLVE